ncbi:MAG: hypothetical protein ACJ8GK_02625 [Luteimonas sp.]
MNERSDNDGIDQGDEALQRALRDLRRDRVPDRDLWPQIHARIAAPAPTTAAHRAARRFAPWAMAASVVLGVAVAWRLQPPPAPQAGLISHEAQAMTREYRGALKVIAASAPSSVEADPALRELDRSAALIQSALAKDPDARFLLDRLRHTYAMRLALTQRAALT